MTPLEQIEDQIRQLSPQDRATLRDWILDLDAEVWDEKIDADARSGKLAALAADALSDHAAGKTREL